MPQNEQKQTSAELNVLADGFHSSITNPFVAVIRDQETYLTLNFIDRFRVFAVNDS